MPYSEVCSRHGPRLRSGQRITVDKINPSDFISSHKATKHLVPSGPAGRFRGQLSLRGIGVKQKLIKDQNLLGIKNNFFSFLWGEERKEGSKQGRKEGSKQASKQGRKEVRKECQEERKEGRKEGRKGGRKEGKKKGSKGRISETF